MFDRLAAVIALLQDLPDEPESAAIAWALVMGRQIVFLPTVHQLFTSSRGGWPKPPPRRPRQCSQQDSNLRPTV